MGQAKIAANNESSERAKAAIADREQMEDVELPERQSVWGPMIALELAKLAKQPADEH